jgi:hypothetical protein
MKRFQLKVTLIVTALCVSIAGGLYAERDLSRSARNVNITVPHTTQHHTMLTNTLFTIFAEATSLSETLKAAGIKNQLTALAKTARAQIKYLVTHTTPPQKFTTHSKKEVKSLVKNLTAYKRNLSKLDTLNQIDALIANLNKAQHLKTTIYNHHTLARR